MFIYRRHVFSVPHSPKKYLVTAAAVMVTVTLSNPALAGNTDGTPESVDNAKTHLEFITDFGANCVSRSAKQILIQNHHPSKPIKVKLFRFFGEVRQPGRAVYILPAGEEPLALGCDKIQGRVQRWDIHKAEFE